MEYSENGELVLMEIVQRNGMSDERFVEERGKIVLQSGSDV